MSKSWEVDVEPEVHEQIAKALKSKKLDEFHIKALKRWTVEIEKHGLLHAQENLTWRDHELLRGKWRGFRAISISKSGRVIYRVEEGKLIVMVVRVTPDHDYS